jgi:hypothetical protein
LYGGLIDELSTLGGITALVHYRASACYEYKLLMPCFGRCFDVFPRVYYPQNAKTVKDVSLLFPEIFTWIPENYLGSRCVRRGTLVWTVGSHAEFVSYSKNDWDDLANCRPHNAFTSQLANEASYAFRKRLKGKINCQRIHVISKAQWAVLNPLMVKPGEEQWETDDFSAGIRPAAILEAQKTWTAVSNGLWRKLKGNLGERGSKE